MTSVLGRVKSGVLAGLRGSIVEVEVDIANGLPSFEIVGLPDAAVRESRERVRAAIRNAGLEFPVRRITVSLSPADLRKEGPHLDLPIAVGILLASGQVAPGRGAGFAFAGALSLGGEVRPVPGVLPLALAARAEGLEGLVVPEENGPEAGLVDGLSVLPAAHLAHVVAWLEGQEATRGAAAAGAVRPLRSPARPGAAVPTRPGNGAAGAGGGTAAGPGGGHPDLADIRGQGVAKRALEVAAAGGHNLLLIGPPGAGKTMLARALPGILPPLTRDEALEVTAVRSAAGLLPPGGGLVGTRPFRAPHHSASLTALIGGGPRLRPGEVTLAHRGVLFLDELPEFGRDALEALRQPLEDGVVTVTRARGAATYPARFTLVAAANPCPCGFHGDEGRPCSCTPTQVARYRARLSGPLLDRLDLHVAVRRLTADEILESGPGEPSERVRDRVAAARERQAARLRGEGIACNAEMARAHLRRFCRLDPAAEAWLGQAYRRLRLTPRGVDRVLKVARTVADLDGADDVSLDHLTQAVMLRQLDRTEPAGLPEGGRDPGQ